VTREATPLDIDAFPGIDQLVEEVVRTKTPRAIRRGGETVAVISPALPKHRPKGKRITPAQREAFLASAGGWAGLVDVERFKRDIKAARSDHRTPPRV